MSNLLPMHLEDLRNSTLTDETIAKYGIVSLSEAEVRAKLNRNDISGGGWFIQYPCSHYFKIKLDKPIGDCKYLSPTGMSQDLFVTFLAAKKQYDISVPYYFSEGEKKAAAMEQLGYAAISIPGVWGWKSKGHSLDTFANLNVTGRICRIIFDSDKFKNKHVLKAEYELVLYLKKRGAIVEVVNLNVALGKGIDDQIKRFLHDGNLEELKKQYIEAPESYEDYVAHTKQGVENSSSPYTGVWNAEKLVEFCGSDIRWCQDLKKWFVWNGKYWKEDPGALAVERMAKRFTKEMLKSKDEDIRKHGKASQNKQKLEDMIELAKSEPGIDIPVGEFNTDGYLLNCVDGTIDLRTGKLLPYDKSNYITRMIKVAYDPQAQCLRWDAFLDEIFDGNQNIISFLQKVAGYCLTDSTQEHCIFILYGTGRNGKNTFLDTLRVLLGDYAAVTGAETLMTKREPDGGAPTEHIASLMGKRLVMASESDEKNVLSEAVIKRISADRTVRCRFLHANSLEYCPSYKIFLVTNHKPPVHGTDEGIWSKLRLIPFLKFILPEKRIPDYDRILLNEEAPGILAWMVKGCLLWQQEGIGMVKEVEEATNQYREEEDFLGNFLKETFEQKEHLEISSLESYRRFKVYAEVNGRHPVSQQKFAKYLESRGFKKSQRTFGAEKGHIFWKGIGLLSSAEGDLSSTALDPSTRFSVADEEQ